jgi:hypothetical protein
MRSASGENAKESKKSAEVAGARRGEGMPINHAFAQHTLANGEKNGKDLGF